MCRFLRGASKFRRTTDGDLMDTLHNDAGYFFFGVSQCSATSARPVNI